MNKERKIEMIDFCIDNISVEEKFICWNISRYLSGNIDLNLSLISSILREDLGLTQNFLNENFNGAIWYGNFPMRLYDFNSEVLGNNELYVSIKKDILKKLREQIQSE